MEAKPTNKRGAPDAEDGDASASRKRAAPAKEAPKHYTLAQLGRLADAGSLVAVVKPAAGGGPPAFAIRKATHLNAPLVVRLGSPAQLIRVQKRFDGKPSTLLGGLSEEERHGVERFCLGAAAAVAAAGGPAGPLAGADPAAAAERIRFPFSLQASAANCGVWASLHLGAKVVNGMVFASAKAEVTVAHMRREGFEETGTQYADPAVHDGQPCMAMVELQDIKANPRAEPGQAPMSMFATVRALMLPASTVDPDTGLYLPGSACEVDVAPMHTFEGGAPRGTAIPYGTGFILVDEAYVQAAAAALLAEESGDVPLNGLAAAELPGGPRWEPTVPKDFKLAATAADLAADAEAGNVRVERVPAPDAADGLGWKLLVRRGGAKGASLAVLGDLSREPDAQTFFLTKPTPYDEANQAVMNAFVGAPVDGPAMCRLQDVLLGQLRDLGVLSNDARTVLVQGRGMTKTVVSRLAEAECAAMLDSWQREHCKWPASCAEPDAEGSAEPDAEQGDDGAAPAATSSAKRLPSVTMKIKVQPPGRTPEDKVRLASLRTLVFKVTNAEAGPAFAAALCPVHDAADKGCRTMAVAELNEISVKVKGKAEKDRLHDQFRMTAYCKFMFCGERGGGGGGGTSADSLPSTAFTASAFDDANLWADEPAE